MQHPTRSTEGREQSPRQRDTERKLNRRRRRQPLEIGPPCCERPARLSAMPRPLVYPRGAVHLRAVDEYRSLVPSRPRDCGPRGCVLDQLGPVTERHSKPRALQRLQAYASQCGLGDKAARRSAVAAPCVGVHDHLCALSLPVLVGNQDTMPAGVRVFCQRFGPHVGGVPLHLGLFAFGALLFQLDPRAEVQRPRRANDADLASRLRSFAHVPRWCHVVVVVLRLGSPPSITGQPEQR